LKSIAQSGLDGVFLKEVQAIGRVSASSSVTGSSVRQPGKDAYLVVLVLNGVVFALFGKAWCVPSVICSVLWF